MTWSCVERSLFLKYWYTGSNGTHCHMSLISLKHNLCQCTWRFFFFFWNVISRIWGRRFLLREGLWTCKTFDSNIFFLLLASVSYNLTRYRPCFIIFFCLLQSVKPHNIKTAEKVKTTPAYILSLAEYIPKEAIRILITPCRSFDSSFFFLAEGTLLN